jgi:hypothetical protein
MEGKPVPSTAYAVEGSGPKAFLLWSLIKYKKLIRKELNCGPPCTEWCGFFLQQSWRKNRTGPQLPTYGGYRAAWVPSLIPRLPSLRLVAGDYI